MDQRTIDTLQELNDPGQDRKTEGIPRDPDFLWKLVHLNPVLWRGAIIAFIALLSSFGLVLSDKMGEALTTAIVALTAIIQAIWTRDSVTPNQQVVVYKPNPVDAPTLLAAGQAISSNVIGVANSAAASSVKVVSASNLPFPSEAVG